MEAPATDGGPRMERLMFIVIAILCMGMFDQPPELLELKVVRGCDVVNRTDSIRRAKGKPQQQPSTYGSTAVGTAM